MTTRTPSGPATEYTRRRRSGPGGPGWLVAAAFIGPGTVTTATVAGARFGVALLWALIFGVVATVVLQEMAARLGLLGGRGLGEAIRDRFRPGAPRALAAALVIGAIGVGNAAYQTGNLLGGALGLQGVVGGELRAWVAALGALAAVLLASGSYRLIERAMTGLVAVMSIAFLATAVRVLPALPDLSALVPPAVPEGGLLLALGLVGTTVVPYNLFLHAAAVRQRWEGPDDLSAARRDLVLSIGVGGLVSVAILVTSAGTMYGAGGTIEGAADMARQLEPLLGEWARILFGVGLFAAGLTSAVTAPLAAAWAVAGALGWSRDLRSGRVRAVWGTVLGVGVAFGLLGLRPVPVILFAQAANGVLLPAVAVFLLLAVNDRRALGAGANGRMANAAGALVVLVTALLGLRALAGVVGLL